MIFLYKKEWRLSSWWEVHWFCKLSTKTTKQMVQDNSKWRKKNRNNNNANRNTGFVFCRMYYNHFLFSFLSIFINRYLSIYDNWTQTLCKDLSNLKKLRYYTVFTFYFFLMKSNGTLNFDLWRIRGNKPWPENSP